MKTKILPILVIAIVGFTAIPKARAMSAKKEFNLGRDYFNATGLGCNYTKAVYWWKKAAVQGYARAENSLANAYSVGFSVKRNNSKAAYWWKKAAAQWKKAAAQGNARAEYELGRDYFWGRGGIKENWTKATYWWKKAAAQWKKAAAQGNARAEYELGKIYVNKQGVPFNISKSNYWFKKAAQQGYVYAENIQGLGYFLKANYAKAAYWYKKAAAQGSVGAKYSLQLLNPTKEFNRGMVYLKSKNYGMAIHWFKNAAQQGNVAAEYYFGDIAYYHIHIESGYNFSYRKAGYWFKKAAGHGYKKAIKAEYELGVHYYTYTNNIKKGVYWLKKAAQQGDDSAQNMLGFIYYRGLGLPKNRLKTVYWWKKAAAQGDTNAINNLRVLKTEIRKYTKNKENAVYYDILEPYLQKHPQLTDVACTTTVAQHSAGIVTTMKCGGGIVLNATSENKNDTISGVVFGTQLQSSLLSYLQGTGYKNDITANMTMAFLYFILGSHNKPNQIIVAAEAVDRMIDTADFKDFNKLTKLYAQYIIKKNS